MLTEVDCCWDWELISRIEEGIKVSRPDFELKLITVEGRVSQDMLRIDGQELQMIITTDESLGNCPKVPTSQVVAKNLVHNDSRH